MAKVDFAKGHGTILSGSVKFARMTNESGPDQMSEKYGCDLELDEASIKQLTDLGILDTFVPKTRKEISNTTFPS